MATNKRQGEWLGTEGIIRHKKSYLTFNYPQETKSPHQKSYAMWDWKNNVLTLTVWIRYNYLVNSEQTRIKSSRVLRELFKPERQMAVVGTECLKSSGMFVVNYQYFAKLGKCPESDIMIKALEIFQDNAVPMAVAEYKSRRVL
ncbi:MAG: hypothetical protein II453_11060 [Alphaproteobacteria bacterium]|nr:hypothetical protein [Alphaproteobacteria bacterium]